MSQPTSDISVKPEIELLEDLLSEVANGRLRVPRFQRPFVWRPEQMLDLFDSIERGYPIGSILIWETSMAIPSLDEVGGLEVPPRPTNTAISYILDGHQRISSLYGSLLRPPNAARSSSQKDWMWWIYRVLGDRDQSGNSFRNWKFEVDPPYSYLPVRSLLRTMDFLTFARDLQERADSEIDVDALVSEAEQLAQKVKSYKVAVIRLVGGSLGHAVEVFSRLNSSGQGMTPDQMVSALTYGAGSPDSLAEQIESMLESLSSLGFGRIQSMTVFQAILAIAGEEDIQRARWDVLARRVKGKLADAVSRTEVALNQAVEFLMKDAGVPLARLVPYNAQLVLITAYFGENPNPSKGELHELQRWFWLTSWSGYFAGANTTQIKNALLEMQDFARCGTFPGVVDQAPRQFPDRFDTRSARVRALLLWQLSEFREPIDTTGQTIDIVRILDRVDTQAYRHVVPQGRPLASSPANRLVMPTRPHVSVKRAITSVEAGLRERFCASNGIPSSALEALERNDDEAFLRLRAEYLAEREQSFMRSWGANPPAGSKWGETDIDTM